MSLLNIDQDFAPILGAPLFIPENMIFFRGYDSKYSAISSRVTHYGTAWTAQCYATTSPDHRLGAFTNKRMLRLLDLRYIQVLLKQLFAKRTSTAFSEMEPMARMTLSYGLCSLQDQIRLMQHLMAKAHGTHVTIEYFNNHLKNKNYSEMPLTVNPFTPDGIRVGETTNDALSLISVKEIFGDWVDGFVAPRFDSVFHVEKNGFIHAEMVLFDPAYCGIIQMTDPLPTVSMSIEQILNHHSTCQTFTLKMIHRTTVRHPRFKSFGGTKSNSSSPDPNSDGYTVDTSPFFDKLEAKNKEAVRDSKQMTRFGRCLRKQIQFIDRFAPHPTLPLTPW